MGTNAIIARLGLDQADFNKGLREAKKNAEGLKGALEFESENKAERNIVGLTTELFKAESAADVLGATLGRIPDIFKSSLLAGAIGGIAAAFIGMAKDGQAAFEKLHKSAADLRIELEKTVRTGSSSEIESGIEKASKKIDELTAKLKEQQGILSVLKSQFTDSLFYADSTHDTRQEQIGQTKADALNLGDLMVRQQKQILTLGQQELQVLELRAKGQDKEADALQTKYNLQREILKVEELLAQKVDEAFVVARTRQLLDKQRAEERIAETKLIAQTIAGTEKQMADAADEFKRREEERGKAVDANMEAQGKKFRELQAEEGKALDDNMAHQADKYRQLKDKEGEALEQHMRTLGEVFKREEKEAEDLHAKLHQLDQKRTEDESRDNDRHKLSLGELAETQGSQGAKARRAQREERRAKERAAAGDEKGAKAHQDKADDIKKGLSGLKDSEKHLKSAFQDALENSEVLKKIEKNTAKRPFNLPKGP